MSENSSVASNTPQRSLAQKILYVTALVMWVFSAFIITQLVAFLVLELGRELFGFSVPKDSQVLFTLSLNAVVYFFALTLVVGAPRLIGRTKGSASLRSILGISRWPQASDFGMAAIAYISYLVISAVAMMVAIQLAPGFPVNQEQDVGFKVLGGGFEYILAFLALVVIAPVAEELLFRGYLFNRLRQYANFVPAAITTSILFGLVHWQWNVGVDVFVLSLALCFLREKTQSLWPAIFLHSLKNGIAFTLLFVLKMPLS